MRLSELTATLRCEVIGNGSIDAEVTGIAYDSRAVEKGYLFAAMPGEHVDGRGFVKAAVDKGASCLLALAPIPDTGVAQVIVPDIRAALSKVSDRFYRSPSKRLVLVGITGTNGKTTTTYLLESIIKEAGFNPGVIGTVNYRYGGKVFSAPHTTPQAPDLHRILADMAARGVTHCVMEVSSHSLEQRRVADCSFRAGIFTNLTHDHLDYHKTMDEYFRCKSMLFESIAGSGGYSIINTDDPWGERLKAVFSGAIAYGIKKRGDVFPEEFTLKDGVTEALIRTPEGTVSVSAHLVGEYNLYNILAAVGAAVSLGIERGAIERGIASLSRIPGRLEKIEAGSFRAYVDYAHTGDALERALAALREISSGRIITVFGCGGNRDRLKRPKMGEIATRLSDITVITSDNPRDEDPLEITGEIEAGIKGVVRYAHEDIFAKGYLVIPDRREAIRKAVTLAQKGDTVLVAGKGHEDYQIVKGVKTPFSDFSVLDEAIRERGGATAAR
ncbi:MAG: UDP-N-acetylmuramoyl-L-alanyl-D-glutamate--2,6-diaminopimelate ligase [Deltaproteobacteria bacterium]